MLKTWSIRLLEIIHQHYLTKSPVRLIAEMGDLSRFTSKWKLVAYAGLDPTVYQSGQMTGEHLRITKKGNKRLRTLVYLAVSSNIKSKKPNSIKEYYKKKSSRLTL